MSGPYQCIVNIGPRYLVYYSMKIELKEVLLTRPSFDRFCGDIRGRSRFGALVLDQVSVDGLPQGVMAKKVLEVLDKHQTLSEGIFRRCQLGDGDIPEIVDTMVEGDFENLKLLSLAGNKFSGEGALELVKGLTERRFKHLAVDLSGNRLEKAEEERLRRQLALANRIVLRT